MLQVFTRRYRGFQGRQEIGEIFEFEGNQWVVIKILNMNLRTGNIPIIEGKVIAQRVGKFEDYSVYYSQQTITDRIKLEGKKPWEMHLRKIGDHINLVDDKRNIRRPAIIKEVESFGYEFIDLVIKYKVEAVRPWTEKQMNEAIREKRLLNLKVISNEEAGE